MGKYWLVFKLTLEDFFVYRLNFLLWRLRSFVFFLTLIFFWQAIYAGKQDLFGYNQSQMLAYVVGVAFLRGVVLGSRSGAELPGLIKEGGFTRWLIKPVSIFRYFFARDLATKFLDVTFAIVEISLVVKILGFDFYFPKNVATYLIFGVILCLAVVLHFLIGIFTSVFAFWFEDVWATRWLFGVIFLEFMAGVFFPLDVLPSFLASVIKLTPFPYLVYFPLGVWNQQVVGWQIVKILSILFFWIMIFAFLNKKMWQKGLKSYAAYGG